MKSGGRCKRVCKDDLREMLDGGVWSEENEERILMVRDSLVSSLLAQGLDVIVDDTNLHPKHERRLREIARDCEGVVSSGGFHVCAGG